jgi:hypothetical protein
MLDVIMRLFTLQWLYFTNVPVMDRLCQIYILTFNPQDPLNLFEGLDEQCNSEIPVVDLYPSDEELTQFRFHSMINTVQTRSMLQVIDTYDYE